MPLFVFLVIDASGQKRSKAERTFQKAKKKFEQFDNAAGIALIEKAVSKDSNHVKSLRLYAQTHHMLRNVDREVWAYKRLISIDSLDIWALLDLGHVYLNNGMFKKALGHMQTVQAKKPHLSQRFYEQIDLMTKRAEYALELLDNPLDVTMSPLSNNINSNLNEYWPHLSPDGKKMYFTRTDWLDKMLEATDYWEENIYVSEWQNGKWQKAKPLSKTINTPENEGAQVLTQDGKTLYYTACNTGARSTGGCDIYVSYQKNGEWTKPEALPGPVNTSFQEKQPSISYDGKYLFFSSDRPGGSGGMDIWVTRMNKDSIWAKPNNLGPKINTPDTEESPFIHVDNNTLYFSSDGHLGLGKGDLYMVKLNDTKGPINLGYPINTHDKQLGIMVSADGKKGYFSTMSSLDSPSLDIMEFDMPVALSSDPVCYLQGTVIDENEKATSAFISIYNSEGGYEVMTFETNNDGLFSLCLPSGKTYNILVNKEGYLVYSDTKFCSPSGVEHTIKLEPIGAEKTFVLGNIYFNFNEDKLKKGAEASLEELAKFLNQNPKVKIEIGGHTDNVGDANFNLSLSKKRAEAVKAALINLTNDKSLETRIKCAGYGATQPRVENSTEENRALNRRTEIKILKKEIE